MFLKLDKIPGDSTEPTHANEIDVVSFRASVMQKGLSSAGIGAGAAKSDFQPIEIYKFLDKSSPKLFVACAQGTLLKRAELSIVQTPLEGMRRDFFKIILEDVFVSSVNENGSTTDNDGNLVETFKLSYSRITWIYYPPENDGQASEPIKGSFDVKRNKTFP